PSFDRSIVFLGSGVLRTPQDVSRRRPPPRRPPGRRRPGGVPVRRRSVMTGLAAVGAGSVLGACSSGRAADLPAGTREGGELVFATDREPTCLDPHNSGDMPQTYIARQYLDSLVSMRPDGSVVPWLADSWEISEDGLVY